LFAFLVVGGASVVLVEGCDFFLIEADAGETEATVGAFAGGAEVGVDAGAIGDEWCEGADAGC